MTKIKKKSKSLATVKPVEVMPVKKKKPVNIDVRHIGVGKSKTTGKPTNIYEMTLDREKSRKIKTEKRMDDRKDTTAIKDDPFSAWYSGSSGLIEPIYNPDELADIPESCSEVGPCIDAMKTNVVGFGFLIRPYTDEINQIKQDMNESEIAALDKEIRLEFLRLKNFFANAGGRESFTNVRKKAWSDMEVEGWGCWEVMRTINGELDFFSHVPSKDVRMTREDVEPVWYKQYCKIIEPDGKPKIETRKALGRFRRYCQTKGTAKIWFKEYGDPRNLNKKTGEWMNPDITKLTKKEKDLLANEMMFFTIYNSLSPYGLPRYSGAIIQIYGTRFADQINFSTMLRNNVPSMFVIVEGGLLTEGAIERLQEFVESQTEGNMNHSRFILLEGETGEDEYGMSGLGSDKGTVKIRIEPMDKIQMKDEFFESFTKNNLERIRRSWRITPIYLGRTDDYTRSTAAEARRLTDEQVFHPERIEADQVINRQIMLPLGAKYHKFVTNSPLNTDVESMVKLLSAGDRSGGLTPEIARGILETILNQELGPVTGIDPDVPMTLQVAKEQQRNNDSKDISSDSDEDIDNSKDNLNTDV